MQGVADFAVFMIYVAIGVGVLAPLFIKNKSYKTVDRGALLITPQSVFKTTDIYNMPRLWRHSLLAGGQIAGRKSNVL